MAITPLSTLTASLVEKGSSKADAETKISTKLGISTAALKADPIAKLSLGTAQEKTEAAKVIKKALVIQKTAETLAKSASIAGDTTSMDAIMDAVMDTVADSLDIDSDDTFDTIMQNTASIAAGAAVKAAAAGNTDANLVAKLEAASEAALEVVNQVEAIDEAEFSNSTDITKTIASKSKALEIVTAAIEKSVEEISKATDTATIATAKTQAAKTTKTVAMLGGVDGIAAAVDAKQTTLGTTQTLKASSLVQSMITDTVAVQSEKYDNLVLSGLTVADIKSVSKTVATSNEAVNFAEVVQAAATASGTVLDSTKLAAAALSFEESKTASNISNDSAFAGAVVEVVEDTPDVEAPDTDTPAVEVPKTPEIPKTPAVEVPETEVPDTETPVEEVPETPDTETPVDETPEETTEEPEETPTTTNTTNTSSSSNTTTDTGIRTVNSEGSITANSVAEIFNIAITSGVNYEYTITGFNTTEDKLNFGTGITSAYINILNTADDGSVQLCYTPDMGTSQACIILDGLTTAEDMALTTSSGLTAILAN